MAWYPRLSFHPGIKQSIQISFLYLTLAMLKLVFFLVFFTLVTYHLVIHKWKCIILKAFGPVVSPNGIWVELSVWNLFVKISLIHKIIIANGKEDLALGTDVMFHRTFHILLSTFLDSNGIDKYLQL